MELLILFRRNSDGYQWFDEPGNSYLPLAWFDPFDYKLQFSLSPPKFQAYILCSLSSFFPIKVHTIKGVEPDIDLGMISRDDSVRENFDKCIA